MCVQYPITCKYVLVIDVQSIYCHTCKNCKYGIDWSNA